MKNQLLIIAVTMITCLTVYSFFYSSRQNELLNRKIDSMSQQLQYMREEAKNGFEYLIEECEKGVNK